jgi:hypothetical protein
MHLTDELTRLAEMHDRGQLSDQEFLQAKKRLLTEAPSQPAFTGSTVPRTLDAPPPVARAVQPAASGEAGNEHVFHSSRWSSGNFFFRDRVTAAADGITFRKGAMFGSAEEHISYRSVASFKVEHGIFLSNITIETAGGSQPIFINGLWKSDAKVLQEIILRHQATEREKR